MYTLYRIYVNEKKEEDAEKEKQRLLSTHPNSVYASLLGEVKEVPKDEDYIAAQQKYKKCYDYYTDGNYRRCLQEIARVNKSLKANPLKAKFELLTALCYGKQGKKSQMKDGLFKVIASYEGSPEAVMAQNILNQLEGVAAKEEVMKTSIYKKNDNSKHRFVALTPAQGINMNEIRVKFSDYNLKYHSFQKLQVKNSFLSTENQILMVINLEDRAAAEAYIKGIKTQ